MLLISFYVQVLSQPFTILTNLTTQDWKPYVVWLYWRKSLATRLPLWLFKRNNSVRNHQFLTWQCNTRLSDCSQREEEEEISILVRNKPAQDWGIQVKYLLLIYYLVDCAVCLQCGMTSYDIVKQYLKQDQHVSTACRSNHVSTMCLCDKIWVR